MLSRDHIFFLSEHVIRGFLLSLLFGGGTATIVHFWSGEAIFKRYIIAYFVDFNCFIAGGILASVVLLINKTNGYVPEIINENLKLRARAKSNYIKEKNRYNSIFEAAGESSIYLVFSIIVFTYAQFPFKGLAEYFMLFYTCIYYALGVYVGRKIYYIARMMKSVENEVPKCINSSHDNFINLLIYINSISILTAIFIYVHVASYYNANFLYSTFLGLSVKPLIFTPVIIGTPVVLLFNFYPKRAVRRIYFNAIEIEKKRIKAKMKRQDFSDFEKMIFLIEYEKTTKDEINYTLKTTLSDFSVFIPIILSVAVILFK